MIDVFDAAPAYAETPHARTHTPPKRSYSAYRDCLRLEFEFRCVYCLATETEVAPSDNFGGFEIEHFKPRTFRRLVNSYANLFWACHACNRAKGDQWPSAAEQALGMRFVDPCVEPLGQHLELSGLEVKAVAASPAGDYMIDEIYLNSAQHTRRRRLRAEKVKRILTLEAIAAVLRQDPSSLPAHVSASLAAAALELETLRAEVLPQPPWDHPASCRCTNAPSPVRRPRTRRERKAQRASAAASKTRAAAK